METKAYITPEIQIINLANESMLCASIRTLSLYDDDYAGEWDE